MPPESPLSRQPSSRPTTWVLATVFILAAGALAFVLARGAGAPATNQANLNAPANANALAQINPTTNTNEPANANQTSNANQPATGTKVYTNTRYILAITLPQSWGRLSEFDGTLDPNLDAASTQNATSVVFGDTAATARLVYYAHVDRSLADFLADNTVPTGQGEKALILGSSPMTTASGLSGTRVSYAKDVTGYDTAFIIERSSDLLEFRFDGDDADASAAVNTLAFGS